MQEIVNRPVIRASTSPPSEPKLCSVPFDHDQELKAAEFSHTVKRLKVAELTSDCRVTPEAVPQNAMLFARLTCAAAMGMSVANFAIGDPRVGTISALAALIWGWASHSWSRE